MTQQSQHTKLTTRLRPHSKQGLAATLIGEARNYRADRLDLLGLLLGHRSKVGFDFREFSLPIRLGLYLSPAMRKAFLLNDQRKHSEPSRPEA